MSELFKPSDRMIRSSITIPAEITNCDKKMRATFIGQNGAEYSEAIMNLIFHNMARSQPPIYMIKEFSRFYRNPHIVQKPIVLEYNKFLNYFDSAVGDIHLADGILSEMDLHKAFSMHSLLIPDATNSATTYSVVFEHTYEKQVFEYTYKNPEGFYTLTSSPTNIIIGARPINPEFQPIVTETQGDGPVAVKELDKQFLISKLVYPVPDNRT